VKDWFQCYGRLWALEWAWRLAKTLFPCKGSPTTFTPSSNILDLMVSEISAFRRTWLDQLLIKNIYILFLGRKHFL